MKKTPIIVTVIIILFMGLGFLLYKISPQTPLPNNTKLAQRPPGGPVALADVSPEDHILGNPDAKNTIIIFEDLQCPACRNFEPTVKKMPTELKDTRVVFRHFPLTTIHQYALKAALAAESAAAQGRFWEFTSLVYDRQDVWNDGKNLSDKFVQIAKDAGVVDLNKFKSDFESQTYLDRVQKDAAEANKINARGTPTLFFNNYLLTLSDIEDIKSQVSDIYK